MSSAPTKYARQGNFLQTAIQGGAWTSAASTLDAELNALKTVTDKVIDRLDEIQRDDGALENGIVTTDSLSSSVGSVVTSAASAATAATAAAAAANAAAAQVTALLPTIHTGTVFGGSY